MFVQKERKALKSSPNRKRTSWAAGNPGWFGPSASPGLSTASTRKRWPTAVGVSGVRRLVRVLIRLLVKQAVSPPVPGLICPVSSSDGATNAGAGLPGMKAGPESAAPVAAAVLEAKTEALNRLT